MRLVKMLIENDEWIFKGKSFWSICALVYIDVGTQNLEVYPNTLLIIQTQRKMN